MIKVAVFGARGRMGAEVCRAVEAADGLELVAGLDLGDDRSPAEQADVAVDFTHPDAVLDNLAWCIEHGLHAVVGTTGFTDDRLDELRGLLAKRPEVGVLVAANFSIGAVLMMHFAAQAASYYESAEIVELHHPNKADAPSGTAAATARRIAAARSRRRVAGPARCHGAGPAGGPGRRGGRDPGARRTAARSGGPPGGAVRRGGGDSDHSTRLARPGFLHARRDRGDPRRRVSSRAHRGNRARAGNRLRCDSGAG